MLEVTKRPTTGKFVEVCIKAPAKDAERVAEAIRGFLRLAGHQVREVEADPVNGLESPDTLHPAAEVFPDSHPGRILRGLRVREGLTQAALAAKAGLKAHHVSEMENRKRPIGKEVARRLAAALNADFRMLL